MIDLYSFLIIQPDLFNILITKIGSSLTIASDTYTNTLLLANLVAYFVIYFVIKLALTTYFIVLPKNFRKSGLF